MKIYAPVKDATGVWASVHFVNGVGETDNPRLIEWFRTNGYRLEKCDTVGEILPEKCEEDLLREVTEMVGEPDFDAMTPNELRQWAIENGYGNKIRNTRNKAKLLEILRG